MNVASLELSKELYELSGWEGEGVWWCNPYDDVMRAEYGYPSETINEVFPAYDLGFLMRKLGDNIELRHFGDWWDMQKYHDESSTNTSADTPEDAACKLAIELFKQHLLPAANPEK